MVAVSVLIPSLTERLSVAGALLSKLHAQAAALPQDVQAEVICITDNRKLPLSLKRNTMMRLATGSFIVHLDDDDDVADDFLSEVCTAVLAHPTVDVICYNQLAYLNDDPPFRVSTSLSFDNEEIAKVSKEHTDGAVWKDIKRKPWHWCAWASRLTSTEFDEGYGEDWRWLLDVLPKAATEHRIDKVLHTYRWSKVATTFN